MFHFDYDKINEQIHCDNIDNPMQEDIARLADAMDDFMKQYENDRKQQAESDKINLTISIITVIVAVLTLIVTLPR